MRSRLIAVFVVGVLAGALLLGGGVFALQSFGDDAEAQSGGTWQMQSCVAGCSEEIEAFVTSLPSECDLEPAFVGAQFYFFYRCPAS